MGLAPVSPTGLAPRPTPGHLITRELSRDLARALRAFVRPPDDPEPVFVLWGHLIEIFRPRAAYTQRGARFPDMERAVQLLVSEGRWAWADRRIGVLCEARDLPQWPALLARVHALFDDPAVTLTLDDVCAALTLKRWAPALSVLAVLVANGTLIETWRDDDWWYQRKPEGAAEQTTER